MEGWGARHEEVRLEGHYPEVEEVEAAVMLSMPATVAGIGTAGRESIAMDPLEGPPRGEPSRTAMMLTPGRVDEVEAAAMLSMPATVAGIGAAGREGIAIISVFSSPTTVGVTKL